MGLIKAAAAAVAGTMDDIWKEMFICDSLPAEVLMVRGVKQVSARSANTGSANVISDGSVIVVADGQCAIVVDGGKVIDSCSEPGEYVFRDPRHASRLGGLLKETGERFAFGGDALPRMQRVYYVNVKECMNNPFRTETPVTLLAAGKYPLYGTVRCSGVFSYRIKDPALFYRLLAGNAAGSYTRRDLTEQIASELLTALGPAIDTLCESGIRPSDIPAHAAELGEALRAAAAVGWIGQHGLEIVSAGVDSLVPGGAGDARSLEVAAGLVYRAEPGPEAPPEEWTCVCGASSTGAFCPMCGRPREWTCPCGERNRGRFCTACGRERPGAAEA